MSTGSVLERGSIFVVGSFVAACSVKVVHLPAPGETLRAESFTLEAGGKGFNTAVAVYRLGAAVDGVFAIGSDLFADFARATFANLGLPESMLRPFPGSTGAGVGFVDRRGENCIAVCPAANDKLSPADIDPVRDRLRQARFVVAQFETGDAPILSAFEVAKRMRATTMLNPSPFRPVTPELLRATDILIVNRSEATAMLSGLGLEVSDTAGNDDDCWEHLARHLFAHGIDTMIVTLGACGMVAWTRSGSTISQAAFAVDAVDSIGAGDACLGGILAGLWMGHDLAESMRWGAACGAMTTTRLGVLDALPSYAQLMEFLEWSTSTENATNGSAFSTTVEP